MIITFCGQKGGTGKTTLSYLVAETLSRAGKKVAIRDDDPQASVSQIVNELRESGRTAVEILDQGREGNYDFIVVDTLPRLSSRVLVEGVKEADRLILPLIPPAAVEHKVISYDSPKLDAICYGFNRDAHKVGMSQCMTIIIT